MYVIFVGESYRIPTILTPQPRTVSIEARNEPLPSETERFQVAPWRKRQKKCPASSCPFLLDTSAVKGLNISAGELKKGQCQYLTVLS